MWSELRSTRATNAAKHRGENRHPSTALAWWTGVMAGRVAGSLRDVPPTCDVAQVRAAVTRSKLRGRVAIVKASNLKTHTSAGSLLVRTRLTELQEHLHLVYTPAYDPDANRHSHGTGLVSRRVVTHNHHRGTFELLLVDVEKHFQALALAPTEILRHIGSPFAPDKDHDAPHSLAQAAYSSWKHVPL
ncbi:MAG TPA: hypothetical protein VIY29_15400 [Ktedonobacteraceae bacterium]